MNPVYKMRCTTRYTNETFAQHFGDGRHKFYLEFRCNVECSGDSESCEKCAKITNGPLVQYFRTYNHGKVYEPVPDRSHIYGGNWYFNGVKRWGLPPSEIIEFALEYQKEARKGFEHDERIELSKAEKQSSIQEMVRPKKVIEEDITVTTVTTVTTAAIAKEAIAKEASVKRSKKPKVVNESISNPEIDPSKNINDKKEKVVIDSEIAKSPSEPKKRAQRKKPVIPSYNTIISTIPHLVHKEVSIPTHIEMNLEKIDIDGYKIEYVKLVLFEVGQTSYFRDTCKNKLYKKIKDKGIGAYVGRWNPDTDSIVDDIPDSDNEN